MEEFLRSWRQEALNRGQHDAAIYIGDKMLALTNSDADAFWLAQVHFSNNNYVRALTLLSTKDLITRSTACRYLAAHCYIKRNQFEQALSLLGDQNPTHLIRTSHSRRKIQHLNGHVTMRNGKTVVSRSDRIDRNEDHCREEARFEAAMCYLRGLCFAKQNAFDRARDCYKDAVRIDVQCFEAFDQLMKNSLMSPAQELEFLESLDFDSNSAPDPSTAQEAAHFIKMLYTTRLSKYSSPSLLSEATETLSTHYNLSENPDILLSRAEALFTQCRFAEALELTSSILLNYQSDGTLSSLQLPDHNHVGHPAAVYPLHLACLYETGNINALFLLAHTLADNAPEESHTYLAIGVYYLAVSNIAEARRFFSKASLLDPHSAPAWIGFAHTFAAEGEHDQAIAAYSTAARLFQGSHLPQLFLGMQHLALNNISLAYEYLCAAYTMSTGSAAGTIPSVFAASSAGNQPLHGDPLVLNELGVVLYHQNHLEEAAEVFRQALALAEYLNCEPGAWVATRANLGHALRRVEKFEEALAQFDECLRVGAGGSGMCYGAALCGGSVGGASLSSYHGVAGYEERCLIGSLHTSRGLILLELGRTMEAVTALHEAVRVLGANGAGDAAGGAGIAGTLLSRALELWAMEQLQRDKIPLEKSHKGSSRVRARSRGKGKQKLPLTKRQLPTEETEICLDELADEALHPNALDTAAESGTIAERVEAELDNEADDMLQRVMQHVRPVRSSRRQGTEEASAGEAGRRTTPAPIESRGRVTRSTRSHNRQMS